MASRAPHLACPIALPPACVVPAEKEYLPWDEKWLAATLKLLASVLIANPSEGQRAGEEDLTLPCGAVAYVLFAVGGAGGAVLRCKHAAPGGQLPLPAAPVRRCLLPRCAAACCPCPPVPMLTSSGARQLFPTPTTAALQDRGSQRARAQGEQHRAARVRGAGGGPAGAGAYGGCVDGDACSGSGSGGRRLRSPARLACAWTGQPLSPPSARRPRSVPSALLRIGSSRRWAVTPTFFCVMRPTICRAMYATFTICACLFCPPFCSLTP